VQAAFGRNLLSLTSFFTYVGLGLGFLGSSLALPFGVFVLICQRAPEKNLQVNYRPPPESLLLQLFRLGCHDNVCTPFAWWEAVQSDGIGERFILASWAEIDWGKGVGLPNLMQHMLFLPLKWIEERMEED